MADYSRTKSLLEGRGGNGKLYLTKCVLENVKLNLPAYLHNKGCILHISKVTRICRTLLLNCIHMCSIFR